MPRKYKIAVVGGGISGLATAALLTHNGHDVSVFEQNAASDSNSRAILLWKKALNIFKDAGFYEDIVSRGNIIAVHKVCNMYGKKLLNNELNEYGAKAISISEKYLREIFLAKLKEENIHYLKRLDGAENDKTSLKLIFSDETSYEFDIAISVEGYYSRLKEIIYKSTPKSNYLGYTVWQGTAEYSSDFIDKDTMEEFLGSGKRFQIIPLGHNLIGWWAASNSSHRRIEHLNAGRKKKVLGRYKGFPSIVTNIIKATPETNIIKEAAYCSSPRTQWSKDRICLIGNAAHPSAPDKSISTNMTIADAAELCNYLSNEYENENSFRRLPEKRSENVNELIALSKTYGELCTWKGFLFTDIRNRYIKHFSKSLHRRTFEALSK